VPAETELVLNRVAQEALTNVARHSGVGIAELTLAHHDGRATLTVRDHGRGLAPERAPGTGIRGMRERATLIGATLEISSFDCSGGARSGSTWPSRSRRDPAKQCGS
jgi:two-component system sensor histidine kinase UhpB